MEVLSRKLGCCLGRKCLCSVSAGTWLLMGIISNECRGRQSASVEWWKVTERSTLCHFKGQGR